MLYRKLDFIIRGNVIWLILLKLIFIPVTKLLYLLINIDLKPNIFKKEDYSTEKGFSEELSIISNKIHSKFEKSLAKKSGEKYKNEDYVIDLTNELSSIDKNDLVKFFNSGFFYQKAKNYLGINPILTNLMIYANLESEINSENEGSKSFHRDSNTYKVFEVFFAVTEITNKNGPFYFYKPNERKGFENQIKDYRKISWENYNRFSEQQLQSNLGKSEILSLTGNPGSWASLNTGIVYHKGGFVKDGYRIVGRAIYSGKEYTASKDFKIKRSTLTQYLIKIHNFIAYKICKYYI